MTSLVILVVGSAVVTAALIWIALEGGATYSVEDAMSHAANYADVIEEGHGRMTMFLWVAYGAIAGWTVYYLIDHWDEFSVIFN